MTKSDSGSVARGGFLNGAAVGTPAARNCAALRANVHTDVPPGQPVEVGQPAS